jgi:hypothetical protein
MPAPVTSARDEVRTVVPKLIELSAMTAARIAKGVFDQAK